jgi:predicted lipid-binding transport protein (Tim44 family)
MTDIGHSHCCRRLNILMKEDMKKFLTYLVLSITLMSFLVPMAEAKRFGGGGSFGKQRQFSQQPARKSQEAQPSNANHSAANKQTGNKWLGPLAGLALGAGLMSLFSGGMAGGFGNILMALLAAGLVMFLIAKFRRPQPALANQQTVMHQSGDSGYRSQDPFSPQRSSTRVASNATQGAIPADFPVEGFIRNAKAAFIRLQAANDNKDSNDVREYTSPEIYAEIVMQMQERGDAVQKTEVLNIQAELLEVNDGAVFTVASVRFTGQLRENNGTPENIDEVWHIQKHLHDDNAKWLLAGIQQMNLH